MLSVDSEGINVPNCQTSSVSDAAVAKLLIEFSLIKNDRQFHKISYKYSEDKNVCDILYRSIE